MKTWLRTMLLAVPLAVLLCGCGSFWGGAGAGAVGAGAGYEINARQQMKRLDDDLESGRIDQAEYDIRKNQIERGSLVY